MIAKVEKKPGYYLDRFEGGQAVLASGGEEIAVPTMPIPVEAYEGDYLTFAVKIDERRHDEISGEISCLRRQLDEKDGNDG
jgi:hypothetical protein